MALFDLCIVELTNFDAVENMLVEAAKGNEVIGGNMFIPAIMQDFIEHCKMRIESSLIISLFTSAQ